MNNLIKAGEVFKFTDLFSYDDKKISINKIEDDKKAVFKILTFDAGTELSTHEAPGEAIVFAMQGEAIIVYEGQENKIKGGEYFKFDKGAKHCVKAITKFTMGLIIFEM